MGSHGDASAIPPAPRAPPAGSPWPAWVLSRTPQQREELRELVRRDIVERLLREIYGTEEIPARYLDPTYDPSRQYTEEVHLTTAARLHAVQAMQSASTSTAPRSRRRNTGWRTRRH